MTTHFIRVGKLRAACGESVVNPQEDRLTLTVSEVNCEACRDSPAFLDALAQSMEKALERPASDPVPTGSSKFKYRWDTRREKSYTPPHQKRR